MWEKVSTSVPLAGLLLENIKVFDSAEEDKQFVSYPYSLVVSQVCDVAQHCEYIRTTPDKNGAKRQIIFQLIHLPAFEVAHFKNGTHFEAQYGYTFEKIGSDAMDRIKSNQDRRFHYILSDDPKIPDLVLDFKHFFSSPVKEIFDCLVEKEELRYRLDHLHYTQVVDRFSHFLQRVAIPEKPEDV